MSKRDCEYGNDLNAQMDEADMADAKAEMNMQRIVEDVMEIASGSDARKIKSILFKSLQLCSVEHDCALCDYAKPCGIIRENIGLEVKNGRQEQAEKTYL